MASYDAVKDLPLTVESCSFEGLEVSLGEFERLTTVVKLQGGRRGGHRRRRRLRRGRPHRPAEPRAAGRARPLGHLRRVLAEARRDRSLPGGRAGARRRLARLPPLGVRVGGARPGAAPGGDQPRRGARPRAAPAELRQLAAARRLHAGGEVLDRAGPQTARRLPRPALQARPVQRLGRRADRGAGGDRRGRLARPQGLLQRHPGRRDHRPRALREADRDLPRRLARGPRRHRRDAAAARPGPRAGHLGRADPLDRRYRGDAMVAAEDGEREALALRPDLPPLRRLRLLRGARASAPTAAARRSSGRAAARSSTWPRSSTPRRRTTSPRAATTTPPRRPRRGCRRARSSPRSTRSASAGPARKPLRQAECGLGPPNDEVGRPNSRHRLRWCQIVSATDR